MNSYLKGGLIAALLIMALIAGWVIYSPRLSVYRNPEQFDLISRMEKEGPPDFELPLIDGDGARFRLSSLRGASGSNGLVTVVNFWASWCNPCVEEFPSFKSLVDSFKGKVALVAVSADEDPNDIRAFLRAFGSAHPNIYVVWDKGRKVADSWGVGKIPESFVLSKYGKLVRKVIGIENWSTSGALGYFEDLVGR